MFEFTDDCLTGIQVIDEEHRQLFQYINSASCLLETEKIDVEALKELIDLLKDYAREHFAHEEAYMQEHCDPELPRQKREHDAFTKKVNEIDITDLKAEQTKSVVTELLSFLATWLYHHILSSDIMIGVLAAKEEVSEDRFAFTDKYRTGIDMIDEEHSYLFDIIRETDKLIHEELLHDKYDKIMEILSELKDYTVKHFNDEEAYMEKINYSGLPAQKRAHEAFVEKLDEIDPGEVDDRQESYLEELIQFLLGWLTNHILKVDLLVPKK